MRAELSISKTPHAPAQWFKSGAHLQHAYLEALVCDLSEFIPSQFSSEMRTSCSTFRCKEKSVSSKRANGVHNNGLEMGGIDVQILKYRPSAL